MACSLVLCSVDDPDSVCDNCFRLLRSGGELRFIEHVPARGVPGAAAEGGRRHRVAPVDGLSHPSTMKRRLWCGLRGEERAPRACNARVVSHPGGGVHHRPRGEYCRLIRRASGTHRGTCRKQSSFCLPLLTCRPSSRGKLGREVRGGAATVSAARAAVSRTVAVAASDRGGAFGIDLDHRNAVGKCKFRQPGGGVDGSMTCRPR